MSQIEIEEGRKRRGQVSREFINQYTSESKDALIALLGNENAQVRTAVATVVGEQKLESAVQPLCTALTIEKALYSRLAICDALVAIGEPAIDPLINLLGEIGSNQHHQLPQKGFYKRSYPLPRDIAARILIRMGLPVLKKIEPILQTRERLKKLEAIDVIGHISNQFATDQCLATLLALYVASKDDDLIQWKIVGSFQAFPHQQVTDILMHVIRNSTVAPLRWEAVRSLGLQDREYDKRLLLVLQNDVDEEVRNLSKRFLTGV
jgi:HEAT repeat protein